MSRRTVHSRVRRWFREIPTVVFFIAAALIAMALIPLGYVASRTAETAQQTAQTAQAQTDQVKQELVPAKDQATKGRVLAGDVATACDNPTIVEELKKMQSKVCQQATVIQQLPPVGPTDNQIYSAVDRWFSLHPPQPGRTPTQSDLVTAATDALKSLGWPPTEDRIRTIAVGYLTAHVDMFRGTEGRSGDTGQPGPGPTDEQVADAVAKFCGQKPSPCVGPPGTDGAKGEPGYQGIGVKDWTTRRSSDGTCMLVFLLTDPANGDATREVAHPVGSSLCDDPKPPASPPPTTTTNAPSLVPSR